MYTITETPTGKFEVHTKLNVFVCVCLTHKSANAIIRALDSNTDDFVEILNKSPTP